jgi:NAD+--asparagine ADP-ribosyltransferase
VSQLPNRLNSFWLWREVSSKLGVSNPAYKYWKDTPSIKLNNKYVFIQKDKLPQKHMHIQDILTDLSGHLPIKFASDQLHVNEHIFSYEKMKLYKEFEYKFVEDVKFVNIKKFFRENGINVGKNSIVQLGKMKDLEISVDSTFYRLKDDYAIVVYG